MWRSLINFNMFFDWLLSCSQSPKKELLYILHFENPHVRIFLKALYSTLFKLELTDKFKSTDHLHIKPINKIIVFVTSVYLLVD